MTEINCQVINVSARILMRLSASSNCASFWTPLLRTQIISSSVGFACSPLVGIAPLPKLSPLKTRDSFSVAAGSLNARLVNFKEPLRHTCCYNASEIPQAGSAFLGNICHHLLPAWTFLEHCTSKRRRAPGRGFLNPSWDGRFLHFTAKENVLRVQSVKSCSYIAVVIHPFSPSPACHPNPDTSLLLCWFIWGCKGLS